MWNPQYSAFLNGSTMSESDYGKYVSSAKHHSSMGSGGGNMIAPLPFVPPVPQKFGGGGSGSFPYPYGNSKQLAPPRNGR